MINRLPDDELLKQVRMQHSERLARLETERRLRVRNDELGRTTSRPDVRQPLPHPNGSWSTASR